MTKAELEAKFEFLETSEEAKSMGLRRVKRRVPRNLGKVTIEDCWAEVTLSLNPDVLDFFDHNSEKINTVLRREMERSKMLDKLLEDTELVDRLREKLAA